MAFSGRIRSYVRKLRSFPANTAHRIISIPAIQRRLEKEYQDTLSVHASALPDLTGLDARICEGLRQDGIFVTSLEALGMPGSSAMFETARRMAADYTPEAHRRAGAGEKYLMYPGARVMMQPVLFTWGLADRLLNIAESYLGLPPAYDGMALVYSVADGKAEATRRWHRDREDRRMVRICIYLNDVDADGGPFELDRRGRDALQADDPGAVRSCPGPAGTVIFADTARCLHRGKPAARDRMAIFYSYFSRRPRNSFYCERSGLSRTQISALTRALPARQVESALWHRGLPRLLRVIPSAPI
ncbi:MAG: 2OG-Fe(II) oxygenase [Sphingomonas sp.]|nr:2OG-Fe(II) oxygenase [Sphingomonas sp.]